MLPKIDPWLQFHLVCVICRVILRILQNVSAHRSCLHRRTSFFPYNDNGQSGSPKEKLKFEGKHKSYILCLAGNRGRKRALFSCPSCPSRGISRPISSDRLPGVGRAECYCTTLDMPPTPRTTSSQGRGHQAMFTWRGCYKKPVVTSSVALMRTTLWSSFERCSRRAQLVSSIRASSASRKSGQRCYHQPRQDQPQWPGRDQGSTMIKSNYLRAALNKGDGPSWGVWQTLPNTNISRMLAKSPGVDWVAVDCEHGQIDGRTHDASAGDDRSHRAPSPPAGA